MYTVEDVTLPGFIFGAAAASFAWLIYVLSKPTEPPREGWYDGFFYSTKRSHRICGKVTQRIADGHWVCRITSVWKTECDKFFILVVDEFQPFAIKPVTREQARDKIIELEGEQEAAKLIRDWLKNT